MQKKIFHTVSNKLNDKQCGKKIIEYVYCYNNNNNNNNYLDHDKNYHNNINCSNKINNDNNAKNTCYTNNYSSDNNNDDAQNMYHQYYYCNYLK